MTSRADSRVDSSEANSQRATTPGAAGTDVQAVDANRTAGRGRGMFSTVPAKNELIIYGGVLLLLLGVISIEGHAAPYPEFSYQCRISRNDQVRRKDAVPLATIPNIKVQDILLQDRLNFHKFNIRDDEDGDDYVYRNVSEKLFISIYDLPLVAENDGVIYSILHQNPLLRVYVKNGAIEVKVLHTNAPQHAPFLTASATPAPPERIVVNQTFIPPSISSAKETSAFINLSSSELGFNSSRALLGAGIILMSMLTGGQVKNILLGTDPPLQKALRNRLFRGMVFFIVSVFILWRSHAVLAFLEVSDYPWFVPLILTVVSAAFVAFLPEIVMFSLVSWPIIGLMIVAALQWLLIVLIFGAIATTVFLGPYVMYVVTIWYPTIWFHSNWGTTAASVYVLAWITFFFITIRPFKEFSTTSATAVANYGVSTANALNERFSCRTLAKWLAQVAHNLAIYLGGNYLPWKEFASGMSGRTGR